MLVLVRSAVSLHSHLLPLPVYVVLQRPLAGVSCAMAHRGRGWRGRGGSTPRSSCHSCGGAITVPPSSSEREGVWHYDILLGILSPSAGRIPLPFSFASIVSELNQRAFGSV